MLNDTENFFADSITYQEINNIYIELYSKTKDLTAEQAISNFLTENNIAYEKQEYYIESEKMIQVIYYINLQEDKIRPNKVKFNIKNVHYAVLQTQGTSSTPSTYESPAPIPGAVSLSLEQQGELSPFYADGIKYYTSATNGGYQGDLTIALLPDAFREAILGETTDTKNVIVENANTQTVPFALGFSVDGDITPIYFWFYNCTATRPSVTANTTEDTKTPDTDVLNISCAPDTNGNVRAKTTDTTEEAIITAWFDSVYQSPGAAA